jgi:hypothetical protein
MNFNNFHYRHDRDLIPVFIAPMDAHGREGGRRGRVNIVPPDSNFKTLVNKNAIKVIKPEIGGPP